ncbi:MAG: hypothetical protein Q9162_002791 [Coniocarpon cinnabarinum]
MPGLIRALVICAAADGLILRPNLHRLQRQNHPTLRLDYETKAITRVGPDEHNPPANSNESLEAHGIVGLLNVATFSYLIAITGRKHVAQIWGKPIFLITDVAFIPVSSQKDAIEAIKSSRQGAKLDDTTSLDQSAVSDLVDDADNDALTSLSDTWLDDQAAAASHNRTQSRTLQPTPEHEATESIARDVIGRKGVYGRFAERWFSKRGWTSGQQRNMGMSSHDNLPSLKSPPSSRRSSSAASRRPSAGPVPLSEEKNSTPIASPAMRPIDVDKPLPTTSRARDVGKTVETVLPKLLQTLKLLLISNTFYFCYDYDITSRSAKQPSSNSDLPLYKTCDPEYFWNAHLAEPLVEGGLDDYVLPIMQGFVGQRVFELDNQPDDDIHEASQIANASTGELSSQDDVAQDAKETGKTACLLTLISRRSKRRAGFRYMRRGIDEKGYTANHVETEQILSSTSWTSKPIYSFVQTRGSIPLYFSQTPYTFKPVPMLHSSQEANQRAFKTHFSRLANDYGNVQAVSLLDRHGPELPLGNAYEEHAKLLDASGGLNSHLLNFEWFDFHHICRGMKFGNVFLLINTLRPFLSSINWTTIDASTSRLLSTQRGVIRTNCMDCLDRTNVVQSAIAQHVLSQQLTSLLTHKHAVSAQSEAFNTLWADNGDALSLTYTGTAALKGDYVRTRRRNLAGVLTDLSLTLNRYYRNLFDDFFAQAALDFVLGNVSDAVFVEFREKMTTADVGIDLDKARDMAIASAGRVVVEESEDLLDGWVVSAPATSLDPAVEGTTNLPLSQKTVTSLRAQPFREVLLLLSDVALYSVTYDWDTEKVKGFERVPLMSLKRLQRGVYITQALTERQKDSERNFGMIVEFGVDGEPPLRRMNTRTLGDVDAGSRQIGEETEDEARERLWAFKALGKNGQARETESSDETCERAMIRDICAQIQRAVERLAKIDRHEDAPTMAGNSGKAEEVKSSVNEDDKEEMSARAKNLLRGSGQGLTVEDEDIVTLEAAQKGTTIMEQMEYGMKRLIWG